MTQPLWMNFQHPYVRDLAWLLLSPSLIDQTLGEFSAYHPCPSPESQADLVNWLRSVDADIAANDIIPTGIDRQRFRRLGLYCESLFNFYLENSPEEKNKVYKNFRAQGEKQTIGECDFIIANAKPYLTHIEIAVKFFLQTASGEREWHSWVGPNAIDRLDIKLERMRTHQLPLPQRKDTEAIFLNLKNENEKREEIESLHFIKGVLFTPFNGNLITKLPENTNPNLLHARWIKISEFLDIVPSSESAFTSCDKMEWLTGPENHNTDGADAVINQIRSIYECAQKERKVAPGLMIWLHHPHEKDKEQTRLMIVPDCWPEIKSPLHRN
ncbi:MAG: DUF1853 family protein [Agarilytica sp.]